MKKLLLLALLASQQAVAQIVPVFRPAESYTWMEFATPEQLRDSSKALEAGQE